MKVLNKGLLAHCKSFLIGYTQFFVYLEISLLKLVEMFTARIYLFLSCQNSQKMLLKIF